MVKETALREVTGSRQSRGRADPEADSGATHEYWAQHDTRRDGGAAFGGFNAGFGPRAREALRPGARPEGFWALRTEVCSDG